ncbi:MAG: PDZ domain-containing protein [Candidatus Eisenbacteria bacterium]|nr:PDZ domain-containing protein [Candidatus Eisenbacteria bacterium]
MTPRARRLMPVVVALIVGLLIGGWAVEQVSARRDTYSYLDLFNDSLAKIEATYVEEVDVRDLMYGAIRGMLSTLDPYSVFFDEESFEKFRVTTEGEFGGLGIQITVRDGVLTVVSPIEGTPAYDLGIRSGDRIVQIEGESTRGITVDEAIDELRGEPGTKVDITILREGVEDLLDYTVTRDIIKIDSVPYAFMIEDGIGYVRVSRFSRTTADELRDKLNELESQGMEALLIDLRSNPGGLLSQAVDVSDIFLDSGELVVSTKGRIQEQNQSYYARTPAHFDRDFPIVALVNGGSASASEILAGSIQDWDRGVVVGTTSFGKGSVQTLMRLRPLTKECAMKITTAKWYIASGRAIEKPEHWTDEEEVAEGDGAGESKEDKPQYRTAGGRVVYGGGGVTPDVIIEPARVTDFVVDLERREEFFEFAIEYVADEGAPPDFEVTESVWTAFVDFLERDEFDFDPDELEEHRDDVELRIRRDMVRHVSGREEAYAVAVRGDGQLNRAVELLGRAGDLQALFELAESYSEEQVGMK